MKKNTPVRFNYVIALALASFAACAAWADNEMVPFTPQSGGTGAGCPGVYTGMAKMTNSAGLNWITPPTNITSGTLTDISGFGAPYASVAYVKCRNTGAAWCDTNSITFPATNIYQYSFTIYVKSPLPPPTNGEPVNLQISWK